MTVADDHEITRLLASMRAGDNGVEDALVNQIYHRLRAMAGHLMQAERAGHTLQPTALVHEALIRLRSHIADAENRRHLFAAARRAMRNVLIDYARARATAKRTPDAGGAAEPIHHDSSATWHIDLVRAIDELGQDAPRAREVVEYRYLLGMTIAQTADLLGIGHATVEKDWRLARAWLYQRLGPTP